MTDDREPTGIAARPGILETLLAVARALDAAEAPFLVGGSLASSLQGIPRSTQDADLVADLATEGVGRFVQTLGSAFYADEQRIRDGVGRLASFNVIDLRNGFKADIYLAARDAFSREQFARRQSIEIAPGTRLPFASPEDVVLQKLRWFRMGGEVSERQWLDALGVLKVQRGRIDLDYLIRWAEILAVTELVNRALAEAGIESLKPGSSGT